MNAKNTFIACGVLAVALLSYAAVLWFSPLPFRIIDRDGSGVVSALEAIDALNIGKRAVSEKPSCTEYFWLKDGLPAYEDCTQRLEPFGQEGRSAGAPAPRPLPPTLARI